MRAEDVPEIDLEEMRKFKEENFRERLKFIDMHVEWLKKKSNKEWSRQQKDFVNT